MQKLSFINTDS